MSNKNTYLITPEYLVHGNLAPQRDRPSYLHALIARVSIRRQRLICVTFARPHLSSLLFTYTSFSLSLNDAANFLQNHSRQADLLTHNRTKLLTHDRSMSSQLHQYAAQRCLRNGRRFPHAQRQRGNPWLLTSRTRLVDRAVA